MSLTDDMANIAAAIAAARRALAEGAIIEIEGLDNAVAAVCDKAQRAPSEARSALSRDLVDLANALDGLAADILRQSEAAERRRASSAYGGG